MQTTRLTAAERASELMATMTVREKAAQLVGVLPHVIGAPALDPALMDEHLGEGIGQICGVGTVGVDPAGIATMTNSIQRHLVKNTRLGIPAVVHNVLDLEVPVGVSADVTLPDGTVHAGLAGSHRLSIPLRG